MKLRIAVLVAAALALPAWAHEGEDHGAPATPAPSVQVGSRTEARTEAFELVVVLTDGRLSLYLDDFATNAPVAGGQVEVESGPFRAVADQAAPGVYRVSAGSFDHPGQYPLIISVQAGDVADLLTATLEVAEPASVAGQASPWVAWVDTPVMAGGAGALVLAGIGVLVARRHRQARTQTNTGRTTTHA